MNIEDLIHYQDEYVKATKRDPATVERANRREAFLVAIEEGWTQTEIADCVGLSRERVRQIVGKEEA